MEHSEFAVLIGSMYIARGMNENVATFVGFGFMLLSIYFKLFS